MMNRFLSFSLCLSMMIGNTQPVVLTGLLQTSYSFIAYTSDTEMTVSGFTQAYGWDTSKIDADKWIGADQKEHTRPYGHQAELFKESLDMARKLCAELGIVTESANSGSGYNIVAVAKAEVEAPDNYEIPDGSNNVKYNTWRYGHPVSGDNYMWCANFVAWCANECGYIDSGLFNKSESVRGVFNYQTEENGFSSYLGQSVQQLGGGEYSAVPGDIWCFQYEHIGIVTEVSDNGIEITQGNTSNRVMSINYSEESLGDPLIANGYIIHVEYPSDEYSIYQFLVTEFSLPPASAVGIISNLWTESRWNPNALGDGGTSYGLCQWHNERWDNLRSFCDTNGYDWESVEGQLRFLKYEIESDASFSAMLSNMRTYPNDPDGAYQAAYDFCIIFERPSDAEQKADQRGDNASDVFYPMFVEGDESAFLSICGDYR